MAIFDESNLTDGRGAAKFLHNSAGTLAIWRCEGRGPAYIKRGRYVRYHKDDLEKWIRQGRVRPRKKQ
jgi:hypothetical protein